jgi:hypothetical protein
MDNMESTAIFCVPFALRLEAMSLFPLQAGTKPLKVLFW